MKKQLTLILLISCLCSFAQKSKDVKLINTFIRDVYFNKGKDKVIVDRHILIPSNNVLPLVESREIMGKLVDSLRSRHSLLKTSKYVITSYADFTGEKLKFNSKDEQSIYIVVINKLPEIYFYVKNKKIASFLTMQKAETAYFITLAPL